MQLQVMLVLRMLLNGIFGLYVNCIVGFGTEALPLFHAVNHTLLLLPGLLHMRMA